MAHGTSGSGLLTATKLRCEALVDPLAVTDPRPGLSWAVESRQRDQVQTAYQILVASSPELLAAHRGDLWDSGKVVSDETIGITYGGRPLQTTRRCWWKVRVWDKMGCPSPWSVPASFGAGLQPSEWVSQWIGWDAARNVELPPAPFEGAKWIWLGDHETGQVECIFTGTLELPAGLEVEHAEMALSVAGRYRFFLGPEQFAISDDDPEPWRRPHIRDLTERIRAGTNRFVIRAWRDGKQPAGVLFKLSIRAADGRVFTLVSDEQWRGRVDTVASTTDSPETWPACRIVAEYGQGPWGTLHGVNNFLPPPAYLRRVFRVPRPVRRATLFATALGWYDLHLNGTRVNETYFDPGWTDYAKRVYYRAFDVTAQLRQGDNAIGAVLADGWYSGYIGWFHKRDFYGKHPRFRCQLHLEYDDGTCATVGSDGLWKAAIGPIRHADILMGEFHDARAEMPGWCLPGFDDSAWGQVDVGAEVDPTLQPHPGPPVVALDEETFPPKEIAQPRPGVWIFNLGQNFAGVVRLKVQGQAGQRITLRFGERLNPDGTLYTTNLRTARATDTYICHGGGEETWAPRFTYHGFQYVEVTGLNGLPGGDTITGVPLSSDTPVVGRFECSDAVVNQLARNVYWSQRSNFVDIPTDCPQRDERMGWTFDAQIFLEAAALRADVQAFFRKWLIDLDDTQSPDGMFPWVAPQALRVREGGAFWESCSPGWTDAGVICPWLIYWIYGDRSQLRLHYPQMVRLVEWYRRHSRPDLLPPADYACLGDWLNQGEDTPRDVIRTAYFALTTGLVARAAAELGYCEDAARYADLHAQIRESFNRAYVQADGRIAGDTQACYAIALMFDLVDGGRAEQAGRHLVEAIRRRGWRLSTGFLGTQPLMRALARVGRNDVAYRLLHNDCFPSWGFSIRNGATTIWERWDGWTPDRGCGDAAMNSFNHYSFGAVYQWMVESIGGIQSDAAAYRRITIAPSPGGNLTRARVAYESVRGLILSEWELTEETLEVRVTIPANTRARIILPAGSVEAVLEGGTPLSKAEGIAVQSVEPGRLNLEAGSGTYRFTILLCMHSTRHAWLQTKPEVPCCHQLTNETGHPVQEEIQ